MYGVRQLNAGILDPRREESKGRKKKTETTVMLYEAANNQVLIGSIQDYKYRAVSAEISENESRIRQE